MTLRFPKTNRDQYEAKVRFQLQRAIPGNIRVPRTSSANDANQSVDNNILNSIFGEEAVTAVSDLFGGKITPGSYVSVPGANVELYLPGGIQTQDGVEFSNEDLNIRGASLLQGLRTGEVSAAGAAGAALNPIGSINAIREAFGNNREAVATTAITMLAQKAPQSARAAVSAGLMRVPNPNTRSLFKGVPIRQFEFSFKLLPQDKDEADEIEKIVGFFRTELYPEGTSAGGIDLMYDFPNNFHVQVLYNNKQIQPGFLDMYLRNVNTTFNPTNPSFYRDGKYSEIDLNLSFVEVSPLTKDRARALNGGRKTYNPEESFDDFLDLFN